MSMATTRWCAWSGVLAVVICIVGFFLVSGFVPPPSPEDNAREITDLFRGDENKIRLGLYITALGSGLAVTWTVAITICMKRIEGRYAPLAWTNLGLGCLMCLEYCTPIFFWQTAAYRSDRPDDLMLLLNDMAWIPFMGMVFSLFWQGFVIAIVIFRDQREEPIYPRWVGYLNIWFMLSMVPGGFLVFFKDGPFAWNGVLSFWVAFIAFLVWFLVMAYMTVQATYKIEKEDKERIIGGDLDPARRVELLGAEVEALRAELRQNQPAN